MAWLGELGVRKLGGQHPQVIRIDSAWLATARQLLPANLPRRKIRHEPESTTCQCGCRMQRIGEDVAEKLDYVPGVFTVERHIRGKWACANQLDHLLSKLRRVRRFGIGHLGPLL